MMCEDYKPFADIQISSPSLIEQYLQSRTTPARLVITGRGATNYLRMVYDTVVGKGGQNYCYITRNPAVWRTIVLGNSYRLEDFPPLIDATHARKVLHRQERPITLFLPHLDWLLGQKEEPITLEQFEILNAGKKDISMYGSIEDPRRAGELLAAPWHTVSINNVRKKYQTARAI